MMSVSWDYFDKFDSVCSKYLPARGEGDTIATQIVTAVCKLVYKWYNDGDVFDNTYYMDGWCNDLSSYANWLDNYTKNGGKILEKISVCCDNSDYENLLKELADILLEEKYLEEQNKLKKIGSIYECDGRYKFKEDYYEDEQGDDDDNDDYDEEEN